MGVCSSNEVQASREQKQQDKILDEQLKGESKKKSNVHTLLLLGAGESGKSTLYKQMVSMHGKGFPPEERKLYKAIIHSNTILAMQDLCRASDFYGENTGNQGADKINELAKCKMTDKKAIQCKEDILKLRPLDDVLTEDICRKMKIIWADKNIRHTLKFRGRFSLADSAEYFFGRLDQTWKPDYIPSLQDVFRSRVRTTGILEHTYVHKKYQFRLFDVGGQRNEREKWIHLFQNVTAVIFVISLSGYDQILYEDKSVNRMHESLRLFQEICNLKWFTRTNMILFLNKSDLFLEKLPHVHLSVCFDDYDGDNDFDSASAFIRQKFTDKNKNNRKQIYTHITNATDTGNVTVVFNTCQDIIITKSLEEAGLLMD
mmetsp:Transcript_19064/g.31058  ORF Transcript_19064/g.31058 Transcript_19064/m.31058 type:complete len:373 (-) Transcript_19064:34-1152(-)